GALSPKRERALSHRRYHKVPRTRYGGRANRVRSVPNNMNTQIGCLLKCAKLFAAVALATFAVPNLTLAQHYTQTNLISDIPGMAAHTDPNLKNSWGLTRSPTGSPWWIANNNSGTSTLDDGNGNPINIFVEANGSTSNFVVVPPPGFAAAGTPSTPTGIVFNGSPTDFLLNKGT